MFDGVLNTPQSCCIWCKSFSTILFYLCIGNFFASILKHFYISFESVLYACKFTQKCHSQTGIFQALVYNQWAVAKIQSWMKFSWNSISLCVFCFLFCFEISLKDFPFFSSVLLTLCLRYLQAHIKERCMYLSSQHFFKTPHKTLKFLEKSKKNAFSSSLQT